MAFSTELKNKIDHWISKYPKQQKQSAVLPALRLVQEENNNYLTDTLMQEVADYLDMSFIAVYEVATFYSMYNLKPNAPKINICTNISCMLAGCHKITDYLKNKNIAYKEVECLGACVNAPVMQMSHNYYENLTPEKVDEILASVK